MNKIFLLLVSVVLISCRQIQENQRIDNYKESIQSVEDLIFEDGKIQLEIIGYTDVRKTTDNPRCHTEGDSLIYSTGFKALNKEGVEVKGCFVIKNAIGNSHVLIRF